MAPVMGMKNTPTSRREWIQKTPAFAGMTVE
jgi:hypothetical protein